MSLQPSLNLLLAQRLLPLFDSDRLVSWAAEALSDGYTSEHLSLLADMGGATHADRETVFLKAVRELGLATDAERDILLRTYACHLSRAVVRRNRPPELALGELRDIYLVSDFDSRYQLFYLLDEDLSSLKSGYSTVLTTDLRLDNADAMITLSCANFLSWEAVSINPHCWGAVYCFSCSHVDTPLENETWLGQQKPRLVCRLCGSAYVGDFAVEEDRRRILDAARE